MQRSFSRMFPILDAAALVTRARCRARVRKPVAVASGEDDRLFTDVSAEAFAAGAKPMHLRQGGAMGDRDLCRASGEKNKKSERKFSQKIT